MKLVVIIVEEEIRGLVIDNEFIVSGLNPIPII